MMRPVYKPGDKVKLKEEHRHRSSYLGLEEDGYIVATPPKGYENWARIEDHLWIEGVSGWTPPSYFELTGTFTGFQVGDIVIRDKNIGSPFVASFRYKVKTVSPSSWGGGQSFQLSFEEIQPGNWNSGNFKVVERPHSAISKVSVPVIEDHFSVDLSDDRNNDNAELVKLFASVGIKMEYNNAVEALQKLVSRYEERVATLNHMTTEVNKFMKNQLTQHHDLMNSLFKK